MKHNNDLFWKNISLEFVHNIMSAVPPFSKMYHGNHSFYQKNRHYSYCYNKTVVSWQVHENLFEEDPKLVNHGVLH